jgi:hypothetical protein
VIRWSKKTTADPVVGAHAFAAAGVLRAARWNPQVQSIEDCLDSIIISSGSRAIPWEYPTAAYAEIGDRQIARAWRYGFLHHSTDPEKVARIVVRFNPIVAGYASQQNTTDIVDICKTLIGSRGDDGSRLHPADVAAVSFASYDATRRHEWQWPLRVGLEPGTTDKFAQRLQSQRATTRQFLSVNPRRTAQQDVMLLTDPFSDRLRESRDKAFGLEIIGTPEREAGLARDQLLRYGLSGDLSNPFAIVDFRQATIPKFMNEFADEIAHNKHLDRALFDAYRIIVSGRKRKHIPPILFVPRDGLDNVFGDVRLENRVKELRDRLARLPGDAIIGPPQHNASALGIHIQSQTVTQYLEGISQAIEQGRLVFDREKDGGTALRSIDAALEARRLGLPNLSTIPVGAEPTAEELSQMEATILPFESEARRFTDLAIYDGHLFPGDDLTMERKLADEEPLVAGREYTLEVAIRLKRTGIESDREADRFVLNPRQDKEELKIYVFAKSDWSPCGIIEPFAIIKWPFASDSDSAFFRLKFPSNGGRMQQGRIEVRLYDSHLDLLDIVEIFATVVPNESEITRPGVPRRMLFWPNKEAEIPRIDVKAPVRALSIHISRERNGYQFEFKFFRDTAEGIKLSSLRNITTADIEALLAKVRDFWTKLVITNYATNLSVGSVTYARYLTELAALGLDAWSLLFGSRTAGQAGSSEALGDLLATMNLAKGTHVQITYSQDVTDFIFPWSILYSPTASSTAVDALQFWGVRYQIEQVRDGPKVDALGPEPVGITFVLDPNFGNSEQQERMFREYVASSAGKLTVSAPISEQSSLFANLTQSLPSHLIYFYCHGYAPGARGLMRRDGVQIMKQCIEGLSVDSPERKSWETLLALTTKMADEPWVFIGDSEIKDSVLKREKFFERPRRPIVFLNMCHSADLLPSMTSGLVRTFLDHNASAVIGTECPMTPVFAHAFSRVFFDSLFSGDDVGSALLKARSYFLSDSVRNPLGLAYSLYGRATARLGNGPLIVGQESGK